MRISVVTVVKNNKAGLLRAIQCVRDQSYKNVEHIIVDGGSTDGTVEILTEMQIPNRVLDKAQNDKKSSVILNEMKDLNSPRDSSSSTQNDRLLTTHYSLLSISEADSGIYDAINKGIKLATGDVIGLLHSDDLYADEKVLERNASVFNQPTTNNKLPTIDAVYSDLVYVKFKQEVRSEKIEARDKKSDSEPPQMRGKQAGMTSHPTTNYSLPTTHYSIIRNWKSGDPSTPLRMTEWIKRGWMPPHPTLFIRKEVFEKYGLYRTDLRIASDYEMILRLLYMHKITAHYLPFTTYLMSIGGVSNKSLKNILQKSKEDFRAMKLNGISYPLVTLISKNLRKLPQFLVRGL